VSAEPLTRERLLGIQTQWAEWDAPAEGFQLAGMMLIDDMIATVQAAEERAERLRSAIENYVEWARADHPFALAFRDALAADDAVWGES